MDKTTLSTAGNNCGKVDSTNCAGESGTTSGNTGESGTTSGNTGGSGTTSANTQVQGEYDCGHACSTHSDCCGDDLFCCPNTNLCMDRDTSST